MGKVTRWLRSLFGAKKSSSGSPSKRQPPENSGSFAGGFSDAGRHAVAVAEATAAAAEAALSAAHAAAEVVRLTTGSGGGDWTYYSGERLRRVAAVRIQLAFRAYHARKALRALKGLVKLQALVRGHIVRKQIAVMLWRMQAMAQLQARAVANRASSSSSPHSSTRSTRSHHHSRSSSMSNMKGSFGQERQIIRSNWFENWTEETSWTSKYDDKSVKILEVDTWKPRINPTPRNTNITPTKPQMSPLSSIQETDKETQNTENTPRGYSASSRPESGHKRSPFSAVRTGEYLWSPFGDYRSHPNFMANTESYQAKARSVSAPRQRVQFERSGAARWPLGYSNTNSERGFRG